VRNDVRARGHSSYLAFMVQRVSGVLLTLFLPVHFWALAQALEGEARLDQFLRWTEQPLVKIGEVVLVVLLAAHMGAGLRLLALELLPLHDWHKGMLAAATAFSFAAGLAFLLNLI
jgi:fumarate reductase subunit D